LGSAFVDAVEGEENVGPATHMLLGDGLVLLVFPECVAMGSCFLSWGSGGGGLFARRFGFFSNRVVPLSLGKVREGDVCDV
jgi:hypothetical protein